MCVKSLRYPYTMVCDKWNLNRNETQALERMSPVSFFVVFKWNDDKLCHSHLVRCNNIYVWESIVTMGRRRGFKKAREEKVQPGYQLHIWTVILFLCVIGLLMVYSASSYQCSVSAKYQYDSFYFLRRQVLYIGLGVIVCIFVQYIHYDILYPWAKWIYAIAVLSTFLLTTSLGVSANGATRWVNIMGIQFQVAEVVKIGVIIGLGYMVQKYHRSSQQIKLTLYMWCMGGVAALLIKVLSNDLSSAIVVLGITVGITFIFTDTLKLHLAAGGSVIGGIVLYVLYIWRNLPTPDELDSLSFRIGRIAAWLKPELYESDASYQTLQALYAIGRGGFFGQGLGQSIQKISALPEAQNDMIFAILCEELGVMGASLLLILFMYLLYYLHQIARSAPNVFGAVLTVGVFLHVALQVIINISVNLNLIPNTGIGLPFISYGGTAVFCQMAEIAMVLSVTRAAGGYRISEIYRIRERRTNSAKSRAGERHNDDSRYTGKVRKFPVSNSARPKRREQYVQEH